MKSFVKKALVVTLLSSTVLSLQPAKSHAIIGIATGNFVLDCIGIITIATGADIANYGINGPAELHRGRMIALLGLFILDDKTQMPAHFGKMSDNVAVSLGYNPTPGSADAKKIQAYNDSLDEINGIHQSIIKEASENSSLKTEKDVRDFARAEWQKIGGDELDASTLEVLTKIQG